MNDQRDNHLERQLRFLQALAEESASIGGDVLEIHQDTWAIHGIIPVDGEVLMAEFGTYDEAKRVLDGVHDAEPGAMVTPSRLVGDLTRADPAPPDE